MSDLLDDLLQKTAVARMPRAKSTKNKQASEISYLNAAFERLLVLFNQVELTQCENLALEILAKYPEQGAVWKVLGAIYQQKNAKAEAGKALRQAVKLLPKDAEAHYNLANFYFDEAQHEKAIQHYRKATELTPTFAIAYFNLGSVYKALEDKTLALACFKNAHALEPSNIKICLSYASALADAEQDEEAINILNYVKSVAPEIAAVDFSLGILYEKRGNEDEALSHYQQTIALEPTHMDAFNNYGLLLNRLGRVDEAINVLKQALSVNDQVSGTYNNLGFIYKEQHRIKEADFCFKKALVLDKNSAAAYNNYGLLMLETGQFAQAELFCLRSLEINPDYDCAHVNLGLVLINMNRHEEAIEHFEAALKTTPDHFMAMANLAIPLKKLNRLAIAEKYLKRAIEIKPDYFNAHLNLASIYQAQGRMVECIESTSKAIEISPDSTAAYSNLLFDLSYTDVYPTAFKVENARKFGQLLTKNAENPYTSWHLETANQRMRIGFVSGDFLEHPVSYFLRNVVANIDKNKFELFAYTTDAREDSATAMLKNHLKWNSLVGLNNEEAAAKIHADGMHILIDLSGHTSGNRLPVFALKPAPVQATWLGYWSTSGVEQIDYLIADETSLPEAIQDQFTEQIQYIPDTRFCFTPPNLDIQPSALPALVNGYLTLGCFQNFAKVSDEVLQLWSQVMESIPNSQLRWQTGSFKDQEVLDATKARLVKAGVALSRVRLIGSVARQDYFKAYHEIDFLLDSFPFSGCTTTCEGLWMGVPTLTLPGNSLVSRQGASFMTAVGLKNWVAIDQAGFVKKAVNFARDLAGLSQLRSQLRTQMLQSLVGDGARFARNLEQVLHNMWSEKMQNADGSKHVTQTTQAVSESESSNLDTAIQEVYQLALDHQLKGELVEAEQLYLEILNVHPRHADANHNLGFIETAQKGAEVAMPRFEIALTENPHREQFWVSFIDALIMSGQLEMARDAISQGTCFGLSHESATVILNEIGTLNLSQNDESVRQISKLNDQFELVVATRMNKTDFWEQSALGLSIKKFILKNHAIRIKCFYENTEGLSSIYNDAIETAPLDTVLIFMHDDVWINEDDFFQKISEGLNRFDIIGIAGNKHIQPYQPAWLFKDIHGTFDDEANLSGQIGHGNLNESHVTIYGNSPSSCELLDGVFLAVKKNTLVNTSLKFDLQFDFHFYDLDFCRAARKLGLNLGTWPINLIHQSPGYFGSEKWHHALNMYFDKWENKFDLKNEVAQFETLFTRVEKLVANAKAHQDKGDVQEAVRCYKDALEINPEHALANHNLGFIEALTLGVSQALPRLEKAVTLSPQTEQFWVTYIDALMQLGALDTAILAVKHGQKHGLSEHYAEILMTEISEATNKLSADQLDNSLDIKHDAVIALNSSIFPSVKKTMLAIQKKLCQPVFYVVAPPYTYTSSGVRCLHILCHTLNQLGYESYISTDKVKSGYNTPVLTPQLIQQHQHEQRLQIAIYPEVEMGNPVNVPHVARYMLNHPNFFKKGTWFGQFHEDEFLMHFTDFKLPWVDSKELMIQCIDRGVYHQQKHAVNRKGFLLYQRHHVEIDLNIIPDWCKPLTVISTKNPRPPEDLAELYRNSEGLILFERTAAAVEAMLCGCPVIFSDAYGLDRDLTQTPDFYDFFSVWNFDRSAFESLRKNVVEFETVFDNNPRHSVDRVKYIAEQMVEFFVSKDSDKLSITPIYQLQKASNAIKQGNMKLAILAYRQAIEDFPEFVEPYYQLALLLNKLDLNSQALDYYEQGLQRLQALPQHASLQSAFACFEDLEKFFMVDSPAV